MTDKEQTDQANLAKTGNAGAQGGDGAQTQASSADPKAASAADNAVQPRQRVPGTNKERQRLQAEQQARAANPNAVPPRNRSEPRLNEPQRRGPEGGQPSNSAAPSADNKGAVEATQGQAGVSGFDPDLHATNIDRELEQRSQQNEEGHEKNLERAERKAASSQDGKLPRGMGRSRDALLNTPVIDARGNKTWKS